MLGFNICFVVLCNMPSAHTLMHCGSFPDAMLLPVPLRTCTEQSVYFLSGLLNTRQFLDQNKTNSCWVLAFFFLKELLLFSMSFCWSPSKFLLSPAIFQISHLACRSCTLLVLHLHTYISFLSSFPFPFKYFSSAL